MAYRFKRRLLGQTMAVVVTVLMCGRPAGAQEAGAPAAAETAVDALAAASAVPMTDIPFYADWAGSPHAARGSASFTHWNGEGAIPIDCAKCHSDRGFLDFIGADGSPAGTVDASAAVGGVIGCTTCHNAATRNLGQVVFPSGVKVAHLGGEARCMTCHQGRESSDSLSAALVGQGEDAVSQALQFVNIHYAAAGATLLGGVVRGAYQYPDKAYAGSLKHPEPYATCIGCHDAHTTTVKVGDCAACHKEVSDEASLRLIRAGANKVDSDGDADVSEGLAGEIATLHDKLSAAIAAYAAAVAGKPIAYDPHAYPYFFNDTNSNGTADPDEAKYPNRYNAWTPRLLKAAYNYQFVEKDAGAFAHNGTYALQVLHDSISDLGTKVDVSLAGATRP